MEFRIAPIFLVIFNLMFLLFINPTINESITLKFAADYSKTLLPVGLLFALSIGTFIRHSFYSKYFKIAYFAIQIINVGLLIYYIVEIQKQNL